MEKGIHAFYKPLKLSSYDIIRKLKDLFPGERIGHGGTLDPYAEGVLVVAIGKNYTRQLDPVLKGTSKEYVATIELGKISETDDSDGPITEYNHEIKPTLQQIQQVLTTFVGDIEQIPPVYSAKKVGGQPAYKRTRRGEKITLTSNRVTIHTIDLLEYHYPFLKIRVRCGSGVYIRSLARDIGQQLQTGAYLKHLLRTVVGTFTIENAIHLE